MRGLYVHVPFCVSKCRYCDFYSITGRSQDRHTYVDSVLDEAKAWPGLRFDTLYLGGGTPGLLGGTLLNYLVTGLSRIFDLAGLEEATIEVNPDSTTPELLGAVKNARFNRISIGVQSLENGELQSVGRVHDAGQAMAAVKLAKEHRFVSISADVIAGLPGQSWESLRRSLETLTGSGVHHISLYCLSVEPGTPLASAPPANLPDDDAQAELYAQASAFLESRGFSHYEISNFALPGHECRHNLNYWRGGEYLGLGPAAASHMEGKRFRNLADVNAYIAGAAAIKEDVEQLDVKAKAAEEAMLRLRLLQEGIGRKEMAEKFGEQNVLPLFVRLTRMVSDGKLIEKNCRFRLPPNRVLTSNSILAEVLS